MASKNAEKSDADVDLIRRLRADGKSVKQIANVTGFSLSTVSKYVQTIEATGDTACESVLETEGDRGVYQGMTDRPIKSEEDALVAFNIDRSVWKVKKMSCTAWTVGLKVKRGEKKADRVIQTQQYRVRLELERILPKALHRSVELAVAELARRPTRWPKPPKAIRGGSGSYMAVMGLFDVHFGKLCWAEETGNNYDLKIAETVLRNAVNDLIAESGGKRISKFVLPFGNDWMHVDSRDLTTTRGTPQDVDGRFSKVLAAAKVSAVRAVELLAAVAPVQVELIPGNHDRTLSECLCHILDARFTGSDRVTVNTSPKSRKYVRYGNSLVGLTHGDMVKPEVLPTLMPADAKKDWSETACHEWITGHGHRSQKWTTKDTDTQPGVVVRMLRALTRTDLWHFDHGYLGVSPAAEVYWYEYDRGYAGHAVVPVREG